MKKEKDIEYEVFMFLCDENKKIRLDGLLKLMIETSVKNSERVEQGRNPHHWIIYSWNIKFYEDIYWKDKISIRTSSRKIVSYYAFRNFEVYKNGKKVLEADSKWILVSKEDKKIIRIPKLMHEIYEEKEGFEYSGEKIKPLEKYDYRKDIKVRKSDIDINGHVNNTNYLYYINEVMDLSDKKVKELNIVYKKEIKYGENIYIIYSEEKNKLNFLIKSDDEIKTIGNLTFEYTKDNDII